ncbi:MAG: hypothetical protein Pg6A_19480 [Termitinemataceae bacterium]|nr:MAG: hypothetical protein Pg6A_19480 [Termitinemataceae bacterium]
MIMHDWAKNFEVELTYDLYGQPQYTLRHCGCYIESFTLERLVYLNRGYNMVESMTRPYIEQ